MRLSPTYSRLLASYKRAHQHPKNQACHKVGIPLIAASIPVAATIVGLPLAAGLFTVGWTFQLAGHLFEGKTPSFVEDRRFLLVGLMWWAEKARLVRLETAPAD
jgi:uncharacterized membrane protein YGL010W